MDKKREERGVLYKKTLPKTLRSALAFPPLIGSISTAAVLPSVIYPLCVPDFVFP